MTPELERLVALYASMRDACPEQHQAAREEFEAACLPVAATTAQRVGRVHAFIRDMYFKKTAAENRRSGRPARGE